MAHVHALFDRRPAQQIRHATPGFRRTRALPTIRPPSSPPAGSSSCATTMWRCSRTFDLRQARSPSATASSTGQDVTVLVAFPCPRSRSGPSDNISPDRGSGEPARLRHHRQRQAGEDAGRAACLRRRHRSHAIAASLGIPLAPHLQADQRCARRRRRTNGTSSSASALPRSRTTTPARAWSATSPRAGPAHDVLLGADLSGQGRDPHRASLPAERRGLGADLARLALCRQGSLVRRLQGEKYCPRQRLLSTIGAAQGGEASPIRRPFLASSESTTSCAPAPTGPGRSGDPLTVDKGEAGSLVSFCGQGGEVHHTKFEMPSDVFRRKAHLAVLILKKMSRKLASCAALRSAPAARCRPAFRCVDAVPRERPEIVGFLARAPPRHRHRRRHAAAPRPARAA